MEKCLIVAVGENGVIGRNNALPWKLADDLRLFKEKTLHHAVIMGRNTWESIPEKYRPLPGRLNIIVSTTLDSSAAAPVARSLEEAFAIADRRGVARAFVIGGVSLYREAIDKVDLMHVTLVHAVVEGDTFLPELLMIDGSRKW